MKNKRIAAALTAVLMACCSYAHAEHIQSGTDLPPMPTEVPQETTVPSETPELTAAPEPTATEMPITTDTPQDTPVPEETATPEPTETPAEAWKPSGEAWVQVGDVYMDGTLESVLAWLCEAEQASAKARVQLLTDKPLSVEHVSAELLERITFEPDDDVFSRRYEVFMQTEGDGDEVTLYVQVVRREETTQEPEDTPQPTPEVTPVPKLKLQVAVDDYRPGQWSNLSPWFALAGIPEGDREHVYGVFLCDRELTLLSDGSNAYVPRKEGEISVRFAILDMMGDVVSLSQQYDMLLDLTPPTTPYLTLAEGSETVCTVEVSDDMSGLAAYSLDGGVTWTALDGDTATITIEGNKGDVIEAGMVQVRDTAGNVAANEERFTFERVQVSWGGGSGTKPIHHVKETTDYSLANYNALELIFSDGPQTQLQAGDILLNLCLYEGSDEEPRAFTATMGVWQKQEGVEQTQFNALILRAESMEDASTWRFSGDVYRLLYNSGVDYLVLITGEYMTAIPTEGFTGGTQYGKLKAEGVSTRKFLYTLSQDELLMETSISVQVEEATYLLEEDTTQPMYRYNVLIGSSEMMDKPYTSYLPEKTEP